MPKKSATFFASPDSSKFASSNPMVKVLILLIEFLDKIAVNKDESIPPDKKQPIGTSETKDEVAALFNVSSRSIRAFSLEIYS